MKRGALLCLTLLGALAMLVLVAGAAKAADVDGCSKVRHHSSTSSTHWRLDLTDTSALIDCSGEPGSSILEGECITAYGSAHRAGGTAPVEPTGIVVYWFVGDVQTTHGSTGALNWDQALHSAAYASRTAFDAAEVELCATTDGTPTGDPLSGSFRMVVRVCNYSFATGNGCQGGTRNYDISTDDGGSPGTGQSTSALATGYIEAGPIKRDPMTIDAAYSTDTASATFAITLRYIDGTARMGAAAGITVQVYDPSGTLVAHGGTVTESGSPGSYVLTTDLGGSPALGVWRVTSHVLQPGSATDYTSASAVFVVGIDVAQRFSDLEALIVALAASLHGQTDYLATNTNATTSPLATAAGLTAARDAVMGHVDGQTDYLATNANGTRDATTAHIDGQTGYLAPLANSTTAPLSTRTQVEDAEAGLLAGQATILENIQDANNTSSGALSYSTFHIWREHEFRASRDTLNDTARETSVAGLRSEVLQQSENSRKWQPTYHAAQAWETHQPRAPEQWLLLGLAVGLSLGAAWLWLRNRKRRSDGRPRRRRARGIVAGQLAVGAALALLAYAQLAGALPT